MELAGRDRELDLAARALEDVRRGRSPRPGRVRRGRDRQERAPGRDRGAGGQAAAARARRPRASSTSARCRSASPWTRSTTHVAGLHPSRTQALGPDLGAVLPGRGRARRAGPRPPGRRALPLPPRAAGAAGAAGRASARSRCCWTICTGPTTRPSSSSCTCCAARRGVPHCWCSRRAPRRLRPGCSTPGAARPARSSSRSSRSSDEAALGLLADVRDPAMRERVAREAGGNPLFLRELARAAGRRERGRCRHAARGRPRRGRGASRAHAHAARRRGRRRRSVRRRARGGAAGMDCDAATLDALVAADLVRPTRRRPRVRVPPPARAPRRLRHGAARVAPGRPRAGGRRARAPLCAARPTRLPRRALCPSWRRRRDRAADRGRSRRRRDRARERRALVRSRPATRYPTTIAPAARSSRRRGGSRS